MNEFIEIAQANFARAEKEKALEAKRLKVEGTIDQIFGWIGKAVILLCTVSMIANTILLLLIGSSMLFG